LFVCFFPVFFTSIFKVRNIFPFFTPPPSLLSSPRSYSELVLKIPPYSRDNPIDPQIKKKALKKSEFGIPKKIVKLIQLKFKVPWIVSVSVQNLAELDLNVD